MGQTIAEHLIASGTRVALVARRADALAEIAKKTPALALTYTHDVRHFDEIPELFQQITKDLGGLDLIVYASGAMPAIDEHEYNFEKDREILEVNLLGGVAWLNEAAKRFEQTKQGTIIGISSVAGQRGRRGNPAYCSSKAGLTTYLEALRNRLGRFGVHVCTIIPGFVDTPMTKGKPGLFWLISSDRAADLILQAAKSKKNTSYVPARWRLVIFIIKMIPSFVFRRLPI